MFSHLRELIKNLTSNERKTLYVAICVFLASAVALGALTYAKKTTRVAATGGEYVEAMIGQPAFVNPLLLGANDAERDLVTLMFSGLLSLSETHKYDEGGKVWLVTLKKDLKWSDGEPLTSDDVLFTLESIQDPAARSPLLPMWQGVVAERLSEREIRFTLRAPYAFFADNLGDLKVVPRHIFDAIPPA